MMQRSRIPEGVLHIAGYVVDFDVFRQLNLDFMPQSPQYDVGDRVTVELRQAGYDVFACSSTYEEPALTERIPATSSPLRYMMHVNRSFNDDGEVIFLHLGRGIKKSIGRYRKVGRVLPDEWIRFGEELLSQSQIAAPKEKKGLSNQ